MARILSTTDDLISEVRSLINEVNQDSLDDDRDIIPALNRAQEHMISLLATHYPEPYLETLEVPTSQSKSFYTIPENAWSDQVTKVEMKSSNNIHYEVPRGSYRDVTKYRTNAGPNVPYYYNIKGRDVELIPAPNGSYSMVMWYVRAPERLVRQQGRITLVDADNNRINVDSLGSDIDPSIDDLSGYFNIVDGQTGEIKATCQVKSNPTVNSIIIKSMPSDTSVLNRTITTDLTTIVDRDGNLNINKNDYICSIKGTCVPYFFAPGRNFVISHAAADVGRALGLPADSMYRERDKFEKEVKASYTGREARMRIKNKSPHWNITGNLTRFRRF